MPLALVAIGSMLMLVACTVERKAKSTPPPHPSAFAETLNHEDLLKNLIRQEERVRGLKVLQVVKVFDQRNGRVLDAQGLLAVQKPDRYRIRLYSPLGVTLWEFVLSPQGFLFRLPSKRIELSGKSEEAGEKIPFFPVEALREAFVHSFEADRIEWQELDWAYLLILHRDEEKICTIRRWINRELLTLSKEVYFRGDKEELSIDYLDYRFSEREEGFLLPHRIIIHLPQSGLRLQIKIIRYEVNPTFRADMFDLSPPGTLRMK
ncbi:MAG: hypothetical protein P8Y09_08590 [Deltaproteobacteria bacterium]